MPVPGRNWTFHLNLFEMVCEYININMFAKLGFCTFFTLDFNWQFRMEPSRVIRYTCMLTSTLTTLFLINGLVSLLIWGDVARSKRWSFLFDQCVWKPVMTRNLVKDWYHLFIHWEDYECYLWPLRKMSDEIVVMNAFDWLVNVETKL